MPETLADCAARCHDPRRGRKPGAEAADGCKEVVHARDAKQLEARNIDGKHERDANTARRASDPPASVQAYLRSRFPWPPSPGFCGTRLPQAMRPLECVRSLVGSSEWPGRDAMSSASATRS